MAYVSRGYTFHLAHNKFLRLENETLSVNLWIDFNLPIEDVEPILRNETGISDDYAVEFYEGSKGVLIFLMKSLINVTN